MSNKLLIGPVLLCHVAASAAPLPAGVAAMIEVAGKNADQLKIVAELARQTNPASLAEIDAQVAALGKSANDAQSAKLAGQSLSQGWSGQVEFGATRNSGNTQSVGLAAALALAKETSSWRHKLTGAVDFQRENDVAAKERYSAAYEGNYKFDSDTYALGVMSFESDRFAGYSARFSEALGVGYRVSNRSALKIDFEAGPAMRQTRYIRSRDEYTVAVRGATNLLWQITPETTLTEAATAYVSKADTTLSSTTAVTSRLIGPLSTRASFSVLAETDPAQGRKRTDTTSRATLVYSF